MSCCTAVCTGVTCTAGRVLQPVILLCRCWTFRIWTPHKLLICIAGIMKAALCGLMSPVWEEYAQLGVVLAEGLLCVLQLSGVSLGAAMHCSANG